MQATNPQRKYYAVFTFYLKRPDNQAPEKLVVIEFPMATFTKARGLTEMYSSLTALVNNVDSIFGRILYNTLFNLLDFYKLEDLQLATNLRIE